MSQAGVFLLNGRVIGKMKQNLGSTIKSALQIGVHLHATKKRVKTNKNRAVTATDR
jgi:hypothetical protein